MGLFNFLKKGDADKELDISPILPEEVYKSAVLDLKDIIAPPAIKITPKQLNLGEKIVRSFFVISYPRFLTEGWFSPIINLDKVFDVSIFIHPVETAKILRQFQKKVAEVQSQIQTREEKGLVRDPMLDTAYRDLEQLRDDLQQANEKIFDVGLYISLYAETEEELNKIESEMKSLLEARLVYVKPALFQQEECFKSVIPVCTDKMEVHSKLNSSPLSSVFPFTSFDLTSDRGILYGINRHNSSLVLFDRYSLENYNSITFAKSGSGKSLRGHEPVLVRKNGKVNLKPIGEVVENEISLKGAIPIDKELEGVVNPGIEVWSFDKNMKGGWGKVSVAARKTATEDFYRFRTRSGRVVETTGDHNMLVLQNGEVRAVQSSNVNVGNFSPLPRFVDPPQESLLEICLLDLLKDTDVYVGGASEFVYPHRKLLAQNFCGGKLDRYLYKYARGRRIPIEYFHKMLAVIGKDNMPAFEDKMFLTSSSGKSRLPLKILLTPALAKILGYLVSEGTITKTVAVISNLDPVVISETASALKELGVNYIITPKDVRFSDLPFLRFLEKIGLNKRSGEKRIPSLMFESDNNIRKAFLSAYFEGDGGVEGDSTISATSKSPLLISDLSYLLYFFGIRCSIATRYISYKGERLPFTNLSITGQENLTTFARQIGFISNRKQKLLSETVGKKANPNVDVIPTISPMFEELTSLLGGQLRGFTEFHPIKNDVFCPSRTHLLKITAEIRDLVEKIKNKSALFSQISSIPSIETLIVVAKRNKAINSALWKELGSSWATIRSGRVPRSANAYAALSVAGILVPSMGEIKTSVREGFEFMRLPVKNFNPSLRHAVSVYPEQNTSYTLLQTAASYLFQQYTVLSQNLPRVEEIISKLERLATSALFWDEIVSIETFQNPGDKYVYDLTVDNEVFLAGYGGLMVHNSYLTKLEILRTLMFDGDVIVIDPEREYEFMAESTGGKYFNISLNSDHHINPFDLPTPREDEAAADVLRSNIINLVGLFRIMLGGITPEEDAIIDRAITETYALKDITADSDFSKVEPPLLSDFEMVLAGMEGGESLVQRLTKYTRGTWAGFINRPSNIDINSKFIVFSLRDMEEELKPVAMYLVTHYIWNAIRKELKKRLLVIDEAWWMMKSEDTASFLLGLAKRGRKYFLGLATITQDVDDFLKSPYGAPIVTNSSIQILLKQSPSSIEKLQKIFNLTDEEKFLLLESDVGEGIFFVGLKHVAIKIIASYTEDQIITSNPSQLLQIKKAKEDLKASKSTS